MIEMQRNTKRMKPVSMVPLINVVFLLLIFFLIAGTVEKFDIVPIALPEAESGETLEEGTLVILLGKYDEIIINDELVLPEDVSAVIKGELNNDTQRVITIKADAQLDATKLIDFIDYITAAGGSNLSLITQASAS